jgi:hypothetical protein
MRVVDRIHLTWDGNRWQAGRQAFAKCVPDIELALMWGNYLTNREGVGIKEGFSSTG